MYCTALAAADVAAQAAVDEALQKAADEAAQKAADETAEAKAQLSEEDDEMMLLDTLKALRKMDFSMIGAVRECESTQDEGQLETGDSSRQRAARGVAAATADMIEANQQTAEQAAAAVVDKPAAGQTATDKPAATADQRAAMRAEDGGNIATDRGSRTIEVPGVISRGE